MTTSDSVPFGRRRLGALLQLTPVCVSSYTRPTARPVGLARSDNARTTARLGQPVLCRGPSSNQKANIKDKSRQDSKPCEALKRSMQRLQEVFNMSSINAMMTRLEMIAKQQGLGFHITDATCYLTADLFYLEVVLLPCGGVEVVKVAPHGGPLWSPSESFLELLSSPEAWGSFSQYNIPGDTELKLKLFDSLQALGRDLEQISHLGRTSDDPSSKTDHINRGIVGTVTFGKEDRPLTVQFYVSPDTGLTPVSGKLLSIMAWVKSTSTQCPGHTAQLTIELTDVHHCLQVTSSITQPPQLDAHGFPVFKSPIEVSCDQVPACFLLKLQPAVAMMPSLWKKLSQITGVPVPDVDLQWAPLPNLLTANTHGETMDGQDIISTVVACDRRRNAHICFLSRSLGGAGSQRYFGGYSSFTHLSHVPVLLKLLRHQCAINSILISAITSKSVSSSLPSELHFEVLPETDTSFTVTFHRPDTDSLSVLVVDVPGSHQVTCRLFGAGLDDPSLEECISAVMKRHRSIPTTLQTLHNKLSERAPRNSPAASAEAENHHPSPSAMDTDTFSQSAAVPGDHGSALSAYPAVSVSQSIYCPK
ncbi:hypothetical protein WMY93_026863 [Mugilogobius chulae]|uniref:Mediator of RNA polymerase II transcription subunit 1 n=1 Tax=Mugilogobius chulae TaxID=88201 RepID=A0AAW0N5H4_9GOBI